MDISTQKQSSYPGLPVFSSLKTEEVVPAVREMLADAREKLEQIRQAEPGWETTVLPMELLNHQISRAWSPVSHMNSVVNTPELRQAYNQCLPLLSDFFTQLSQDQILYVGPSLSALIVTVMVSTDVKVPSDTVSWKVTSEFTRPSGAVKVGEDALASESVTEVPAVWTQV